MGGDYGLIPCRGFGVKASPYIHNKVLQGGKKQVAFWIVKFIDVCFIAIGQAWDAGVKLFDLAPGQVCLATTNPPGQ
jgi:hypothetical protein